MRSVDWQLKLKRTSEARGECVSKLSKIMYQIDEQVVRICGGEKLCDSVEEQKKHCTVGLS